MNFRIPPETQLERLKLCAAYLSVQRGLRRSGWGSIGWGVFTLGVGLLSKSHTIFDAIWIVIGLFLVLEGTWILRAAAVDPRVLQFEAAALLLLGLWNTVGLYFEIQSGMKPLFGGRVIIAGILQLIGAYSTFRSYPHYKRIYEHLDRACLHELEIKIGDMWKQKTLESGLVEFKVENKKCRAKLLPDLAIVLSGNGRQVSVAERSEVTAQSSGNKLLSKALKVQLAIDTENLKAEMKPDCYTQWQDWIAQKDHQKITAP
jgi:hypothetical protein